MISNLKKPFLLIILLTFPFVSYSQNSNWERDIQRQARKVGENFYFISLQEIAEALKASTFYSNKARKAVLYLGTERVTVTAFNPFILVGRKMLQMPIDTKYADGDILLPVKFFIPIVKDILSGSVSNGITANGVDRISTKPNITAVRVEQKTNGTLIRVNTLEKFKESNISTRYSRGWLYLDIYGGRLDTNSIQIKNDRKLVKKIVPEQFEQMTQIAFQFQRDVSNKKFNFTQRSNAIWLSIPSNNNKDILDNLESEKKKWRIDKIVIDPGHGGKDPGTIGPRGTYEKDVVLAIGKKLKSLIQKKLDVKVFMTRDSDKYISLEARTQFANKVGGKLFISIHANSNRNKSVNGSSTYFLGLARTDEALEIAARENAVIKHDEGEYSELTDEKIILATMAQSSFNKESQDFAAIIQEKITKQTGIRNRGVLQAGFYVLVGASMPNVMVETAFMSNRKEERLLKSSFFQDKVAKAIYESVIEFKRRYELTMN